MFTAEKVTELLAKDYGEITTEEFNLLGDALLAAAGAEDWSLADQIAAYINGYAKGLMSEVYRA